VAHTMVPCCQRSEIGSEPAELVCVSVKAMQKLVMPNGLNLDVASGITVLPCFPIAGHNLIGFVSELVVRITRAPSPELSTLPANSD